MRALLVVLLALAGPALAIRPLPPLILDRIAIVSNGARSNDVSSDETATYCKRFRLSAREVRGAFVLAERVDARAYHHDLPMSRCHAAGTASLPDGSRIRWTIDRARRASLTLADGTRRWFYCLRCTAPAFDPLDEADRAEGRAIIDGSVLDEK